MAARRILLALAALWPLGGAAEAESWIVVGTNQAFRPELQADFSMCADADSVKADAEGWTTYTWKLCGEPREIFESSVKCAGDLSADQIPTRTRSVVANGKPKPGQPWKTEMTYGSSMGGTAAKWACHK